MSTTEIDQVRKFLKRREERRRKILADRLEYAKRDFDRIVNLIIEKYSPQRIYQWGSLLHTKNFSEISDIDIAVEGLNSSEQYFSLLCEADELTDFPLDLVEMEKIHLLHAESIRKKGRVVYERP